VSMDLLLRFVIGGLVVSAFSMLGDLFKPKSFAGLFAAAPTIALATMALTLHKHGAHYLAIDARSMASGAAAFFVYASACSIVLMHSKLKALSATALLLPVWGLSAAAFWALWLRGLR
jgi:uncharacterized membrane protein (GlpM family)